LACSSFVYNEKKDISLDEIYENQLKLNINLVIIIRVFKDGCIPRLENESNGIDNIRSRKFGIENAQDSSL
jgi:hypothetical protein